MNKGFQFMVILGFLGHMDTCNQSEFYNSKFHLKLGSSFLILIHKYHRMNEIPLRFKS